MAQSVGIYLLLTDLRSCADRNVGVDMELSIAWIAYIGSVKLYNTGILLSICSLSSGWSLSRQVTAQGRRYTQAGGTRAA